MWGIICDKTLLEVFGVGLRKQGIIYCMDNYVEIRQNFWHKDSKSVRADGELRKGIHFAAKASINNLCPGLFDPLRSRLP